MQFSTSPLAVKALLVLLFALNASAFWRMPCMSRSGLARLDPLISPGTTSQHVHAIHGSSGFSESSGHAELVAGNCTSCQVSQDKSAYWTPALYFQHASTGQYELVQQVGGMLAYYLLYPNAGETTVEAFPAGFQMIAGDTFQRNFSYPVPDIPKSNWDQAPYNTQAFLQQAALGFNCLNYAKQAEGSLYRHFLPDKAYLDANCIDGVRFELMFPSCWNGSLDSTDHKSHVAYPSEVMTGDCPPEYPKRLVSLFYETIWNTYEFVGQDGQFVISNGDPTGYGYHGDFIMGWDEDFLQEAVNTCTNLSGEIQDCPLFDIQDSDVWDTCSFAEPAALASDNVLGPVGALPGNVPIAPGPAYAMSIDLADAPPHPSVSHPATTSSAAISVATSNPVPTLSYSSGLSLGTSDTYIPGAIFAAATKEVSLPTTFSTSSTTSSAPPPSTSSPTTTSAPTSIPTTSPSFIATQYMTTGQVVEELLWVEELVTVTVPATTTVRSEGRSHIHKHRHVRRHL